MDRFGTLKSKSQKNPSSGSPASSPSLSSSFGLAGLGGPNSSSSPTPKIIPPMVCPITNYPLPPLIEFLNDPIGHKFFRVSLDKNQNLMLLTSGVNETFQASSLLSCVCDIEKCMITWDPQQWQTILEIYFTPSSPRYDLPPPTSSPPCLDNPTPDYSRSAVMVEGQAFSLFHFFLRQ